MAFSSSSLWLRRLLVVASVLLVLPAFAQKTAPGPPSKTTGPNPPPMAPFPDTESKTFRPLFVSGNVVFQGGAAPPEPVAIERVCNGLSRREGYTDSKGQFQIEMGRPVEQDASEGDPRTGGLNQSRVLGRAGVSPYEGCELRAILPGFQSTSVTLHMEDDFGQVRIGTLVLTRQGNVPGSTISVASLSAPKNARQAYEKGRKAQFEKKFSEAEKELSRAVEAYPRYAAAWFLLGEVHRVQLQLERAAQAYSKAIACEPEFVSPYFALTIIAINQRNWPEVQRLTDQLIRLNEFAYPLAFYYNSAANYNLGRIEEAERSALKFQSVDTDHRTPEVARLLAKILEAKQDYAGAAQELRNYLALVPGSAHAAEVKADLNRLDTLSVAKQK
jgi:cytochrome c-type biogenesis protein CcmH/NrfG